MDLYSLNRDVIGVIYSLLGPCEKLALSFLNRANRADPALAPPLPSPLTRKSFGDLSAGNSPQVLAWVLQTFVSKEDRNLFRAYSLFATSAIDSGSLASLRWLLDHGFPLHHTCFEVAARKGHIQIIRFLLDTVAFDGWAVRLAPHFAEGGHKELVFWAIRERNEKIDAEVVHKAIISQNFELFKELLDAFGLTQEHLSTFLGTAAIHHNMEVVKYLHLERGVTRLWDFVFSTHLKSVLSPGGTEVALYLLENGLIDPSESFERIIEFGNEALVKVCLDKGALIRPRTLIAAASAGHVNIFDLLLERQDSLTNIGIASAMLFNSDLFERLPEFLARHSIAPMSLADVTFGAPQMSFFGGLKWLHEQKIKEFTPESLLIAFQFRKVPLIDWATSTLGFPKTPGYYYLAARRLENTTETLEWLVNVKGITRAGDASVFESALTRWHQIDSEGSWYDSEERVAKYMPLLVKAAGPILPDWFYAACRKGHQLLMDWLYLRGCPFEVDYMVRAVTSPARYMTDIEFLVIEWLSFRNLVPDLSPSIREAALEMRKASTKTPFFMALKEPPRNKGPTGSFARPLSRPEASFQGLGVKHLIQHSLFSE